jgi:hypothetical protein
MWYSYCTRTILGYNFEFSDIFDCVPHSYMKSIHAKKTLVKRQIFFPMLSLCLRGTSSIMRNSKLKVVGNEKLGGSRCLQLLGISLGLRRLMSIFFLNMTFTINMCISFSA